MIGHRISYVANELAHAYHKRHAAFLPHARAKKLPRAAECLVYSLTPSGVLAENHPKIGVSSASCGVKNAQGDVFHGDLPLESGLAARARCLGFLAGVAAVSRPRSIARIAAKYRGVSQLERGRNRPIRGEAPDRVAGADGDGPGALYGVAPWRHRDLGTATCPGRNHYCAPAQDDPHHRHHAAHPGSSGAGRNPGEDSNKAPDISDHGGWHTLPPAEPQLEISHLVR